MTTNWLDIFHPITAGWFSRALGKPTAVQEAAWPAIASGEHTLVSAPTGTGKTLSAFLVFIDRLMDKARAGNLKSELELIYISPLKSLAGDIRENLKNPFHGIMEEELSFHPSINLTSFDIRIAIRTGDTPQKERRNLIKTPPHILITTPESLFLMLSSPSGKKLLSTAKAIIIDELHAMIDSKRGAHLMLSVARLDKLCKKPLQRIGLSATMEPLDKAAQYLSPDHVIIAAPRMQKKVRLEVLSPRSDVRTMRKDSLWHEIARSVYDHCTGTRSVIAFLEGRAYAEKLAFYVNLLGGEGFARTHHGSLSKEQRFEVENDLRNGKLRLLCATSSMELGIDVGEIDRVLQIGCPRSISSTMQRLGRAGHNPERVSVMHLIPRTASEGLFCGLTAEAVRRGGIEASQPPRLCLDILAQHLVSMASTEGYSLDEVLEILSRAYPFQEVSKEDVCDVLCMLAGDYEHDRNIPVRPRILYDRIHEWVEGDPYSRMLAVSAGGTIPDKGLFSVKTENGIKLGEVDEEFVFEAHIGDKFLLGTFSWQISRIQKDTVVVKQSSIYGAKPPFYRAEVKGRKIQTGITFGSILRKLNSIKEEGNLIRELNHLGLDDASAKSAENFIHKQMEATGILPDDKTIVIEHFKDDTGSHQMMVHSIFGQRVNAPLAILTRETAKQFIHTNISCFDDDDGFLLFPYGEYEMPEGLLQRILPEMARPVLEAVLPATPLFHMSFRYNSAHALMMGVKKTGRQPLWVQRLRSAQMLDTLIKYENHPLIRETKRECLEDYWDLNGVEFVLSGINSGRIKIRELWLDSPSPMSLPLRRLTEATMMYDYSPTSMGVQLAAEEALKQAQMIAPSPEQLAMVSQRRNLPANHQQLHTLLMIEGDLIAGELNVPIEWLETLVQKEQVKYIEPGLWIAAEHSLKYASAMEQKEMPARLQVILRLLRYRGPQTPEQVGERYFWSDDTAAQLLSKLCEEGSAVEYDGLYYHAELYERAQRETVKERRRQIRTLPSEHYAALITNRIRISAPPAELMERSLKLLCDLPFQPTFWESVIFPARVPGYRPELLDSLLSQGNYYWVITSDSSLCFHRYEDINWESDLTGFLETLDGNEKVIYEALLKRGASFMQRLSGLLGDASPYDTLLKLAGKGLVSADSFFPVRQWMNEETLKKATLRQRVTARSKAMTTGRWELVRPRKELSMEEQLERAFDRSVILSKETAQNLPWEKVLETLRVWEYTGRVRRGYFIEGLSGIQFIRETDFTRTMQELEQPYQEIIWLSAVDPAQPWGKYLTHLPDKAFLSVPGSAVALLGGRPVAVFERQGKVFRVFEEEALYDSLTSFAYDYNHRRIFPGISRVVVKQYPDEAGAALEKVGFFREMQDYVLYRGS